MFSQSSERPVPAVLAWYTAYCLTFACLFLFLVVIAFIALLTEPEGNDPPEDKITIAMFAGVGLLFALPYAAGPFLPRKKWAWVLGIVLICIGMSNALCLPVAIPLLIWWLKAETKAYYNANRD